MTIYFVSDTDAAGPIKAREAAAAYRANYPVRPGLDDLLAAYRQAYPYANPLVISAFAEKGLDPTSTEVQKAMEDSLKVDRKKGIFDKVGDFLFDNSPVNSAQNAVGDVAGDIGDLLDGPVEAGVDAVKAGIRTSFVVLESPLQEVQNFSRAAIATTLSGGQGGTLGTVGTPGASVQGGGGGLGFAGTFGSNLQHSGTSSLREFLSDPFEADLGTGFLPGGDIEAEVKRQANQLRIRVGDVNLGGPGNPSITIGRTAAATVFEPGDAGFNIASGLIDAGVAWFGDPASAAGTLAKESQAVARLGRAGNILRDEGVIQGLREAGQELITKPTFAATLDRSRQGRMVHDIVGRIPGVRKTLDVDTADSWLQKAGARVVRKIAETDSFTELHAALGNKVPVALKVRLADARTEQEVIDILRPEIGVGLREAPQFLGFKARKANKAGVRLFGGMPANSIDPNDLDDAVQQVDNLFRNAKASTALRNKAIEAVARNESVQTMVATLSPLMDELADELAGTVKSRDFGTTQQRASKLTRLWNRDVAEVRTYLIDEIAENRKALGIKVGPDALPLQEPYLYTEYLNNLIPLPDARDLRRATSSVGKFVDTPFFERSVAAVDAGQSVWKRITLLRGAYTARVIGEEQLRMAASGLDSMFAHPMSFIAGLVGDDGRFGRHIRNAGRRATDATGAGFHDDVGEPIQALRGALNEERFGGWVDFKKSVSDAWRLFTRDDGEAYTRSWLDGLGEMHRDPIARRLAQADGNLDTVKTWLMEGEGKKFRLEMTASHPEMATWEGVDEYIDYLYEGLNYRTMSDPVLLEAVATGKFNGEALGTYRSRFFHRSGQQAERYEWSRNTALNNYLADAPGPASIKGRVITTDSKRVGFMDNSTSWMFDQLGTKPTNFLSRSQTFKQRYWQRIEEMLPYAPADVRATIIANGEKALLPEDQLKRMREVVAHADAERTFQVRATKNASAPTEVKRTVEDFDDVAKKWALDETKDLLYDMSDRGQFFDAFRLVFPFGEAWKEVLTRWAKIGTENPKVFRRGQQVMEGARGAGFFHKDINGEETFTYPFSRQISRALIGTPIDLTGRVAGLSLMTEVLPGVGPVVQLPAAAIVPDTPTFDWLNEALNPYGGPDTSRGFMEALAPGFIKNGLQYFRKGDPRLFANTVGASMDYLASTGKYDMANPVQAAQLVNDAKKMAKNIYALRAVAQFVSPTSPMPETLVADKDGDLAVARVMIDEFHELEADERYGYDGAPGEFLKRYGEDFATNTLGLLMQGKSTSIPPRLPTSKQSAEWERANPDIVAKFRNTWGLFAPSTGGDDDMDYQAYIRQFQRGDRQVLTGEQRIALAQARIGRYVFDLVSQRIGDKPSTSERTWLAQVKEKIREVYPGFGKLVPGMPVKVDTDTVVAELQRAINNPKLSKTRQAEAARLYLRARDNALKAAAELGLKTFSGQAATDIRERLAEIGRVIVTRYPEFGEFYDSVFAREVDDG